MINTTEILNFNEFKKLHIESGKKIFEKHKNKFCLMTIFAWSVLNRSLCLTKAFIQLIKEKNYISAAPLVRLQLDNVLRFSAAGRVEDANKFVEEIFQGKHVTNIKDKDGNKMTDSNLVDYLKEFDQLDWIELVYKNTSGYIHLSDKHIYNTFKKLDDQGKFEMKISEIDTCVPKSTYNEALIVFRKITILLLDLIDVWIDDLSTQLKASDAN